MLNLRRGHPINALQSVTSTDDLLAVQGTVWDVHVDETLQDYIVKLVIATRQHTDLALGISPRGSIGLYKTAQALAAIRGRDHVLPEDIKYLVPYVFIHRLIVRPEAELRGRTPVGILKDILQNTPLKIE
jgi:MoxR-like ATPase